ncbi:transcriptional Coactivator p15-domain-containing protein [Mrakia frigida]|uniref:transcriptional coactivator p15/PC4 family protein n=1 Tax=Mrakia frigida TaxID=29902 RepID=UPI003FCC243A
MSSTFSFPPPQTTTMAKRTNDDSDDEDQLREDDDDQEDGSEEDLKPKKVAPKKKIEPNFKKTQVKEVEKKKPAAKKPRKSAEGSSRSKGGPEVQTNDDGFPYIELGGSKRVSISEYKGKTLVDIREYYTDKSTQEEKPGKKGISLNPEQFKLFAEAIGLIEGLL